MTKTATAKAAPPTPETTVAAPEITALQQQIADLTDRLHKSDERATVADIQRRTAEAHAQVEAWQREGMITGDATRAVRSFYVALATGQEVTIESFANVMASLPRFDTRRISAGIQPRHSGTATLADFKRSATDVEASKRIDADVAERRRTNPKFTAQDLLKELKGGA